MGKLLARVEIGDSLESKREAVRARKGKEVFLRDCSCGTSFNVSYKSGYIKNVRGSNKSCDLICGEQTIRLRYENLRSLVERVQLPS